MPKRPPTLICSPRRQRPSKPGEHESDRRKQDRNLLREDGIALPKSPQEFYEEMTKRPDVREILKQLAQG